MSRIGIDSTTKRPATLEGGRGPRRPAPPRGGAHRRAHGPAARLEHGITDIRVTRDIDVLGQARPQGTLTAIDEILRVEGFEPAGPDLDGVAHRYQRGDLIVDVLAPDGLNEAPKLGGGVATVGVPGGSQALTRSVVTVSVDGREFELRRPTLLGANLIKDRSVMRHAAPEAQREDPLRLLALVEDPRAMAAHLRKSERKWLRQAEADRQQRHERTAERVTRRPPTRGSARRRAP